MHVCTHFPVHTHVHAHTHFLAHTHVLALTHMYAHKHILSHHPSLTISWGPSAPCRTPAPCTLCARFVHAFCMLRACSVQAPCTFREHSVNAPCMPLVCSVHAQHVLAHTHVLSHHTNLTISWGPSATCRPPVKPLLGARFVHALCTLCAPSADAPCRLRAGFLHVP